MKTRRINLIIPTLIFAVTLPAAVALVYHRLSGDPTMQPLGITISKLAERGANGKSAAIVVEVNWGVNAKTSNTRAEVTTALRQALSVYNVDYLVRLNNTESDNISVYFNTGSGRLGPYRLANTAAGIAPAIAAFRLAGQKSRPD